MLDNATNINSAAQELANDVSMVTDEVDQLEQRVREDKDAITMATDTAIESIAVTNNLTEQITTIQVKIKSNYELLATLLALIWRQILGVTKFSPSTRETKKSHIAGLGTRLLTINLFHAFRDCFST